MDFGRLSAYSVFKRARRLRSFSRVLMRRRVVFLLILLGLPSSFLLSAAENLSERGDRLFREGDFCGSAKVAHRAYRSALKNNGFDHDETISNLAVLISAYRAEGKSHRADKVLTSALARTESAGAFRRFGSHLIGLGNIEDAEIVLNRALQIDEGDAETLAELGRLHKAKGNVEKAAEFLRRSLDKKPDSFWLRMELAKIYQLQGKHQEAEKVYKGFESLSRDRSYYVMLGYSLSGLGENREADQAFQKGRDINPRDPLALHHLATNLEKEGKFGEAETTYRRAVELFEQNPDLNREEMLLPLHHLGALYIRENRYQDAERIAERIVSMQHHLPPGVPWDRVVILPVQFYAQLGQVEKAERLCREALSRPAESRFERLALLIEFADLLDRDGRREEAKSVALDAAQWMRAEPLELERKKEYLRLSDLLTERLVRLGLDTEAEIIAQELFSRWREFLEHSGFAAKVVDWVGRLRRLSGSASLDEFSYYQLLDLFQTSTGLQLSYYYSVANRLASIYSRSNRPAELEAFFQKIDGLVSLLLEDFRVSNREQFIGQLIDLFPLYEAAGRKHDALLLQKWVPLVVIKLPDKGEIARFLAQTGALRQKMASGEPTRVYERALSLYEEADRPDAEDLMSSLREISDFYIHTSSPTAAAMVARKAMQWRRRLDSPQERRDLIDFALGVYSQTRDKNAAIELCLREAEAPETPDQAFLAVCAARLLASDNRLPEAEQVLLRAQDRTGEFSAEERQSLSVELRKLRPAQP